MGGTHRAGSEARWEHTHLRGLQDDGKQGSQGGLLTPPTCRGLVRFTSGGTSFSKLNISHAYLQLKLDVNSSPLLTINTSKGLYQYTCLPFGVAAAPAIFQRTIDNLLRGIPHTAAYMDDILVTEASESEHQRNLEEVFKRLSDARARLKKQKCAFMLPKVEYWGHHLSTQGLRPTQAKVRVIVDAPAPRNVTQLRSFLGLIIQFLAGTVLSEKAW